MSQPRLPLSQAGNGRDLPATAGRLALLLVGALCACGCNVIGFAAAKTLPPPRVPAAFELGESPTAVVVKADEVISGEFGAMDGETVAIALERSLRQHTKARITIESAAVQVVRVKLDPPGAETPMGSEMQSGQASARVSVATASGTHLWPPGGDGELVEVRAPRMRSSDPGEVRRATLHLLGQKIAALFYSREMQPDE